MNLNNHAHESASLLTDLKHAALIAVIAGLALLSQGCSSLQCQNQFAHNEAGMCWKETKCNDGTRTFREFVPCSAAKF